MFGNWVIIDWSLSVSHLGNLEVARRLVFDWDVVIALLLDVFIDVDSAVNEILLGKHGLEDLPTVIHINSVKVLRLGFFFSDDINAIEHA